MERCKSLTKNFVCAAFRRKRTLNNATAKINLCFIRLMLKRLTITYIPLRGSIYAPMLPDMISYLDSATP
nr:MULTISPECIES: hypothetical protein [unclassified Okeania]